jgi:2-keto-4-pentenoate hydratase/2-oxohepta-3-ene-1,7-dioic acid hydratase in catechol pathway
LFHESSLTFQQLRNPSRRSAHLSLKMSFAKRLMRPLSTATASPFSLRAATSILPSGSHGLTRIGSASASLPLAASFSTTTASNDSGKNIVRFRAIDGEEHFGVFSDALESKAHLLKREGGKTLISDETVDVEIVLPPVDPPAIFAVGLNYADHAAEVKMELPRNPIVFSKTINTLTGHNTAIILPRVAKDEIDYEAELAVVIGRECKDVSVEKAMDYVLGFTIAQDITARKWQGKKGGNQWTRGKSFDTFLPLGPFLVPKSEVKDPHNLRIRTWINDELRQDGNTSLMVKKIPELISFISQDTTLLPGSVILTGTPAGVGYVHQRYLQQGDVIRTEIEGLGVLRNVVVSADEVDAAAAGEDA